MGLGSAVVLYEPGHVGGKLRTSDLDGRLVDEAADAFLARHPAGLGLCQELGLTGELEAPAAQRAMLYLGNRLRPLPEGLVLGAPARVLPLARSGILSPLALARAGLDLALPRQAFDDDIGVAELVSSRFGRQVAERLVNPLLGSVYAGSTEQMSTAATAPPLLAAARANRSLLLGLRAQQRRSAGGKAGTAFLAPKAGMQALAAALWGQLEAKGALLRAREVSSLTFEAGRVVLGPDGEGFAGVVLAVPAPAAARILGPALEASLTPDGGPALAELSRLVYSSVGLVAMSLPAESIPLPQEVSGVLVGRGGGGLMTACSFGSHKWPRWASPGREVVRASVGRAGDQRWQDLTDEDLVQRLHVELGHILCGKRGRAAPALPAPVAWRVSRWPGSFPQYRVGHLQMVDRARKAVRSASAARLALAGAAYDGVGVPACITSGRQAARAVWGGASGED